MIEIVLVAAGPDHPVDARAATNHLAHGLDDRAVVDLRAGLGSEGPVMFAALVEEPGFRDQNAGLQVCAARFEQQDLRARILGQAPSHDRTGGSRSNDDIVVARTQSGSTGGLVCRDRPILFGGVADDFCGKTQVGSPIDEGPVIDLMG